MAEDDTGIGGSSGMGFSLRVLKAVLLAVVAALSVVVALPMAVLFWIMWPWTLVFQRFSQPAQAGEEPPQVDNAASQISIENLLGLHAPRQIDAVFEGGGVKAIAQVGAVRAAEDLKLKWSLLGGTSGGAIVASLLAAGKNSRDIWQILTRTGLHSLVAVWYLPRLPWLQKRLYFVLPLLPHLLFTKGLVSGAEFLRIMNTHLQKNDQQLLFRDIPNHDRKQEPEAPRYRLKMVATDISRGTPIILPDDLPYYWEPWDHARRSLNLPVSAASRLSPEDAQDCWPVAESVRMSMSIPFFFNPYALHLNVDDDGKSLIKDRMGKKGKKVLIVDGGISSNFPIWLFDTMDRRPTWPTFGFLLDETKGTKGHSISSIGNLIDMALSVVTTGMGAMDKRLSEHDQYRTTRLRTLRVNTTSFGLSLAKQSELFESGFQDAVEFFKRFDWGEYLSRFRRERSTVAQDSDDQY
ncbi:MAG: patatin-like phospholipase family protein [Chloroflexi bacterium]|nr:patatin-like phospholipase family protein [Chloroflexota bacterium]